MAISPHTPPGTPLVVVKVYDTWDAATTVIKQDFWEVAKPLWYSGQIRNVMVLGQRLTLVAIEPNEVCVDGFVAMVAEVDGKFSLQTFSVATLPSCLTDILASKPVDHEVLLPCDC